MPGTLYIVATPIGNLDDISLRAIRLLGQVGTIAAEDTRHTGRLLAHLGIKKPMLSYQEHNEKFRIPQLLELLRLGQDVALVSDAGTPGISDPGFKLIREAIAANVPIDAVPGPSAVVTALIDSGLPTDRFYFGGFLPRTSAKRRMAFGELAALPATLIFFESPYRLAAALADARHVFPDRPAAVARELTKLHQEVIRGTVTELNRHFAEKVIKGEIVLLIGGLSK